MENPQYFPHSLRHFDINQSPSQTPNLDAKANKIAEPHVDSKSSQAKHIWSSCYVGGPMR